MNPPPRLRSGRQPLEKDVPHLPIPIIREQLDEVAKELRKAGLNDWADRVAFLSAAAVRRSPTKRAPITSTPMTAGLARLIRSHSAQHPKQSHQDIAALFNVNPGRVSQALQGDI